MSKQIVIEHNEKKYVYEFDNLCVEQAEIAKEAAIFRSMQKDVQEAKDIELTLENRGIQWMSIMLSYLLLEEKDGEVRKFDRKKVKDIEAYVRALPSSQIAVLKDVVSDFFMNMELGSPESLISPKLKKINGGQSFMETIAKMNLPNSKGSL